MLFYIQLLGQQVTEAIVGVQKDASSHDQLTAMKLGFSTLLSADTALVREQLQALLKRLQERNKDESMLVTETQNISSVHVKVRVEWR